MSNLCIIPSPTTDIHNFFERKNRIWVASSGGFDPLHAGHIRMLNQAKTMGDIHITIINNDNWLRKKKGINCMPENERAEIILSLYSVDGVVLTDHPKDPTDMSVSQALRFLRPNVFVNGGDRKTHNTPEDDVCQELGIHMEFNVGFGGKVQSSSWIITRTKQEQ